MALETIETTIDGVRYRIGQLPWMEGAPIFRILVRAAGDALLGALLKMTAEEREALANGDRKQTLPFAMRVLGNLEQTDTDVILLGLGKVIEVAAGETDAWVPVLTLRSHFSGRYTHLIAVYWAAAAHNFSNPT